MFKLAVGMTVGELSAYSPETKQLFDGLLAYINRNDTIKRSIFSSFFQESREVKLMDYYDRNEHYLAIKVDDKGNATIDDKNLVNLLQIDMKPANEANKAKFE